MPWKISKENGEYCVYKHDAKGNKAGAAKGCHPSRAKAIGQLRALYANVPEASSKAFAFKGLDGGNYIWLWTSNAFKDREEEIFSTKALEDYVARRDLSGKQDRVWFWHIPRTDFADVVWSGVQGRILVELAHVDATEYGQKMFNAIASPGPEFPEGFGTSHGYLYKPSDLRDGVYTSFEKFETTVLPFQHASNQYGGVKGVLSQGDKQMAINKAKRDALVALVGEDEAKLRLEQAEQATKQLEAAQASYKEAMAAVDDEEDAAEGDKPEKACDCSKCKNASAKKEAADDDGQLMEMEVDDALLAEIAEAVDVESAVKAYTASDSFAEQLAKVLGPAIDAAVAKAVGQAGVKEVVTNEQIAKQALSGKLTLRPYRASQAADNRMPADEVAKTGVKSGGKDGDDVVSAIVGRMLSGI